jgi:hypothetical protein
VGQMAILMKLWRLVSSPADLHESHKLKLLGA